MSEPATRLNLALSPYAQLLGLRVELRDGRRVGVMPFAEHLVGNPTLPALHGGTLGGLLESMAHVEVIEVRPGEPQRLPKTVTLTVQYLRSGKPVDTFVVAKVLKSGRRVSTVFVSAFQEDEAHPIATATVVLKM
ncbi:MAG: thioesterase family protein [Myxococcaceae bacterium]